MIVGNLLDPEKDPLFQLTAKMVNMALPQFKIWSAKMANPFSKRQRDREIDKTIRCFSVRIHRFPREVGFLIELCQKIEERLALYRKPLLSER